MAELIPLSQTELGFLKSSVAELPDDYLEYLRDVGWGETPGGYMIYSGPVEPKEIYGRKRIHERVLLLGNDFRGIASHTTSICSATARFLILASGVHSNGV